jgi:hypothetical protein
MTRKRINGKSMIAIALFISALTVFVVAGTLPYGSGVAQKGGGVAPTPTPLPLQPQPGTVARTPQNGRRDLSRYDKLEPLVIAEQSKSKRDAALARARGFLLEHWRGRRLGHVVISFPGPADSLTPSAFYVEPDSEGHWTIVLETAGRTETFRFVEEVDIPENGPPIIDPHAGEQQRPSGAKGLHLKQSERANTGMVL